MPIMSTILKCVRCGRMCEVTLQSREDPRLRHIMNMADLIRMQAAHNLCASCRAAHNWHASQGRTEEFINQIEPPHEVLGIT